jgi:hypothetical protein
LIERVPKTHRYRLTNLGLQTALFYTRVYSRILRPGLALVSPPGACGLASVLAAQLPHRRAGRQHLVRSGQNRRVENLIRLLQDQFSQGI